MRGKISKKATSVKEIREIVEAAEKLDLEPVKWSFFGCWEDSEGRAVFLDSEKEIEKVGYKYLHLSIRTDRGEKMVKIAPETGSTMDDGSVRVHLG